MHDPRPALTALPLLPTGTVYGVLMNFPGELAALGESAHQPPYQSPPRAPVLYIKPANTFRTAGSSVTVPAELEAVEVGATVALVLGSGGHVAALRLLADLSEPHGNHFRPPVKARCRDGFLVVGAAVAVDSAPRPDDCVLTLTVDGQPVQNTRFDALVRPPAALLADVTEFMTLHSGDHLMLGCDRPVPLARPGQRVELSCPGLPTLAFTLTRETA